jgi:hypothetical protein
MPLPILIALAPAMRRDKLAAQLSVDGHDVYQAVR